MAKKPKSPSPKAPKAETFAGVSKNSPFAPFASQILSTFIQPIINRAITSFDGKPPSMAALTKRYNELAASRVSVATMRAWLKQIGFGIEVRPVLYRLDSQPIPSPAAPTSAAIGSSDGPWDGAPPAPPPAPREVLQELGVPTIPADED